MRSVLQFFCPFAVCLAATFSIFSQEQLPGSRPLELQGDLSALMVSGLHKFLLQETAGSITNRAEFWRRDLSSVQAYVTSVETNRQRLRKIIGATDPRVAATELEFVSSTTRSAKLAETDDYIAYAVRWPVFEGV